MSQHYSIQSCYKQTKYALNRAKIQLSQQNNLLKKLRKQQKETKDKKKKAAYGEAIQRQIKFVRFLKANVANRENDLKEIKKLVNPQLEILELG